MQATEFFRRLRAIGLTRSEFESLVGLAARSTYRYTGEAEVPSRLGVVLVLMEALREAGVPFEDRLRALELHPMRARGRRREGGDALGA
jgi:hypothetical protein